MVIMLANYMNNTFQGARVNCLVTIKKELVFDYFRQHRSNGI